MNVNVTLMVVPKPGPGGPAVMQAALHPPTPVAIGHGSVNLLCGGCSFVVAENLESAGQLSGVVLRCSRCEAYNRTRV